MTQQLQEWAGDFGAKYHARNRVGWWHRKPFWRGIIEMTCARSVYEVGCGPGGNLTAIRSVAPHVQVYGCEPNEIAVKQARAAGLDVFHGGAEQALATFGGVPTFDLVFTCGVLIHVPDDRLPVIMRMITSVSAEYVLAIEYAAASTQMVEYRGRQDMLWRRPYGDLYATLPGKRLWGNDSGEAGEDFDNAYYWLMSIDK